MTMLYEGLLAKTLHKEDKLYKYIFVSAIVLSKTKKGLTR